MLNKLIPTLTAAERKTVQSAKSEFDKLWKLAEKYQRPRALDEHLHPLHIEADAALQTAAAIPSAEAFDAVLAAFARKNALTERLSGDIGNAILANIAKLRASLAPIAGRLVDAARAAFDAEADAKRQALPPADAEAAGVIGDSSASALEAAITAALAELEMEIEEFTRDPLTALPALCES